MKKTVSEASSDSGKPIKSEKRTEEQFTTIYRDKLTGRRIDLNVENLNKQVKEKTSSEKYRVWGKNLSPNESSRQKEEDGKPFAIYHDDIGLNEQQRRKQRWGDPLANLSTSTGTDKILEEGQEKKIRYTRSTYRGPPPPPNRFNISPGYRWDGVNRSNGYEVRYFESIASRIATKEEAYKWSVEDM
jgi:pre-mRNA-splicing factor CWC26